MAPGLGRGTSRGGSGGRSGREPALRGGFYRWFHWGGTGWNRRPVVGGGSVLLGIDWEGVRNRVAWKGMEGERRCLFGDESHGYFMDLKYMKIHFREFRLNIAEVL